MVDKNKQMHIIGNNLRRYRHICGLTQSALAEQVGLETSSYTNLENGKRGVSVAVLRGLADALGVSVDCLIYEDDQCDKARRNIEMMLQGKPEPYVTSVEKLIRVCIEEFPPNSDEDEAGERGAM